MEKEQAHFIFTGFTLSRKISLSTVSEILYSDDDSWHSGECFIEEILAYCPVEGATFKALAKLKWRDKCLRKHVLIKVFIGLNLEKKNIQNKVIIDKCPEIQKDYFWGQFPGALIIVREWVYGVSLDKVPIFHLKRLSLSILKAIRRLHRDRPSGDLKESNLILRKGKGSLFSSLLSPSQVCVIDLPIEDGTFTWSYSSEEQKKGQLNTQRSDMAAVKRIFENIYGDRLPKKLKALIDLCASENERPSIHDLIERFESYKRIKYLLLGIVLIIGMTPSLQKPAPYKFNPNEIEEVFCGSDTSGALVEPPYIVARESKIAVGELVELSYNGVKTKGELTRVSRTSFQVGNTSIKLPDLILFGLEFAPQGNLVVYPKPNLGSVPIGAFWVQVPQDRFKKPAKYISWLGSPHKRFVDGRAIREDFQRLFNEQLESEIDSYNFPVGFQFEEIVNFGGAQ